jgi:hypothetical protein
MWHVGFKIKIRDLQSHSNSFLEPQHVKNISELFNKNLSSNHQSLFTCQTACRSEYKNFTSTIVVDDNIHCSTAINEKHILLFSVDLDPVRPYKENILMA